MSDDRAFLNGHAEPTSLPPDLAAVEQRLTRDGAAWQQEMPATTRLAAYVTSRAPRHVAARSHVTSHKGQHVMDTPADDRTLDTHPSRYRRSFPIVAALLLIFAVGGYFGLQAIHQQAPIIGHPGLPSPQASATAQARWFALTDVVYTKGAATPVENFALGNDFVSPQHLHLQSETDPQQIQVGDVLNLTWEINGQAVTGPNCCLYTLSAQHNGTDFTVPITAAGTGVVKLYYNTTLAYTATFTIVAHDTPPPTVPPTPLPRTPTPVSGSGGHQPSPLTPTPLPGSGGYQSSPPCQASLASHREGQLATPTPIPCTIATPTPVSTPPPHP